MKKIVLLGVFSLIFIITGCRGLGGISVRGQFLHGYNAPPSHAPAHGRRSQHRYHYYPNAEFYFDVGTNMYFYLDVRSQWAFSVTLPLRLRHHLHNNYVEIEMDHDRPYQRHKYHKNKYKKHKTKYKRKHKYKKSKKKHKKHHDDDDKGHRNRGRW